MAYFVTKRRGKGFKMGSIEGGVSGKRHWLHGGAALFILHLHGVPCQPFSLTAFFFSWFDMFCGGAYGLCILEILTCLTLIVHCGSEVREHPAPCKKTSIFRYIYVVLFGWLISRMHWKA